ncbi:TPA: AbrB/MazE/SpoVT family DNA-binding domain-containing protein [Candidatus Bathyarchaeota archaeon]|nr:AbrB/MazE/SpoVT family DNA-binding domain-containing protein [Candidatus Bathyarchaeota archaeon]
MRLKSTVSPKGQVVIPKEIRELLRLKPGSKVLFEVREGRVEVKPVEAVSLEDFINAVPRERKLRERADLKKIVLEEALRRWST